MSDQNSIEKEVRKSVLGPVDRASEMLFGLLMALTFVGAVSVATAGRAEIHTMLAAALGCNLAWGLVDGIMYLVGTVTDRGHSLPSFDPCEPPRTRRPVARSSSVPC